MEEDTSSKNSTDGVLKIEVLRVGCLKDKSRLMYWKAKPH